MKQFICELARNKWQKLKIGDKNDKISDIADKLSDQFLSDTINTG